MAQTFQRPIRRFKGPIIIVERRVASHWDGRHRQIPVAQVPLERRRGMLHVTCARNLSIYGPETGSIYPNGANFEYVQSYHVYLEVLPRGKSDGEYQRMVGRPPFTDTWSYMEWLEASRTPMVVSRKPHIHSGETTPITDAHLTLLEPAKLRTYLTGVMPYLGVDPADIPTAVNRILSMLEQGGRELAARNS